MDGFQRANVYTIPPDVPFLKTLANAILDGSLLPPEFEHANPLALSTVTIYLPTQRSVRLLEDAFLDAASSPTLILPTIKALGSVDEDDAYFDVNQFAAPEQSVLPAISPITRQLVLTRLVMSWGHAMSKQDSAVRSGDQPLLVPASPADAAWLAADLGELLDRAITEEISWDKLGSLVEAKDLAAFWKLSVEFLKIVTELWPNLLKERGLVDPATRRDLLIAQEQVRLATTNGPVIAAGSTGTLPSTARFLAAVAKLPNGRLVLPGFDKNLDEAFYEAIGGSDEREQAISGHPQYGMKQLLSGEIGILPDEVDELGTRNQAAQDRSVLVSHAMLPAPVTNHWPQLRSRFDGEQVTRAFEGVTFVNAKSDSDEALAIATALREFVNNAEGYAALVTPDRALARRVALELQRWGLKVDDSAGRPLPKTALAVLSQLAIETVASDCEPVKLLALLKHPLATFGLEPLEVRRAARVLDLAILRGPRIAGGMKGLSARLENMRNEVLRVTGKAPDVTGSDPVALEDAKRAIGRLHPAIKGYAIADWDAAETLVTRLREIFEPLETLFAAGDIVPVSTLSKAHQAALSLIEGDGAKPQPARKEIASLFETIQLPDGDDFEIKPYEYPKLYRALLGNGTVRERGAEDPRILILGALEARLLNPEFIVLAALDEGSWPKQADTDAFMSRSMRAEMALEAPERRIGLAAHDVCQGLGAPRVMLTRAAKRGGTPTVMSRWLQRLLALIGEGHAKALEQRGRDYLNHAASLDKPLSVSPPSVERPNPKPPVETRPTSLSVTRIEVWVRDPYAIYADRILQLKPIDPLGHMPGFAERGTIIHEALDRFNKTWDGVVSEEALQRFLEIGRKLFIEEMADFPDQRALWWPRFERIAHAYLAWEENREPQPTKRHSEVYARLEIPVDGEDFVLSGTVDRLDELADGSLSIVDFKTGNPPSAKQVKSGLASQLPLEVVMHHRGAFEPQGLAKDMPVSELGWVKLDGREDQAHLQTAIQSVKKGEVPDTPDDLGDMAEKQLLGLIKQYRDPNQGYMSRPRPDFDFRYVGPYDHLARVKEWLVADQEEGE
ncbi:MAG: double-strand break repair protein AddB [Hyphomicrobiales bacterium]